MKDQGSAGSCWAFSTVGNVEGQWALKTGNVTSLSAEQLVECDDQNCGAYGGWPYIAYSYIEKVGGISSENDYPYCVGDKKCFHACLVAGGVDILIIATSHRAVLRNLTLTSLCQD